MTWSLAVPLILAARGRRAGVVTATRRGSGRPSPGSVLDTRILGSARCGAAAWTKRRSPPRSRSRTRIPVKLSLSDAEVERIAASISRYEPAEHPAKPEHHVEAVAVTGLVAVYQRWLEMPDAGAVYAVLGTIAAHRLRPRPRLDLARRPAGLGQDRGPAGHRRAGRRLPDRDADRACVALGDAHLIASSPRTWSTTIGESGIILCKDFGSVLSMHRESRGQVLAALREIFDGSVEQRPPSTAARPSPGPARSASSAAARPRSTARTPSWRRWSALPALSAARGRLARQASGASTRPRGSGDRDASRPISRRRRRVRRRARGAARAQRLKSAPHPSPW